MNESKDVPPTLEEFPLRIGTVPVESLGNVTRRISQIIWGPSGVGKTTLACTAPGKKLHICFDPDGYTSIPDNLPDYLLVNAHEQADSFISSLRNPRMAQDFCEQQKVKTIILDSTSTMNERALAVGAADVKATIDAPTLAGYGRRNTIVLDVVSKFLTFTSKLDMNLIVIAHEDSPTKNELDGSLFVTLLLGGQLPQLLPIKFSEVWYMDDNGRPNERVLTIRSSRTRKPMKSRMFVMNDKAEFTWRFDPVKWQGDGIATWHDQWVMNGHNKIPLPK
jgi:hypothetical protein